jgi:WD40 repeat protein
VDCPWANPFNGRSALAESVSADANAFLSSSQSTSLLPGKIHMIRCPDANICEPSEVGICYRELLKIICTQRRITSVSFHSEGFLLAVGGDDKRLRIFNVDGDKNRKLSAVCFADMPIKRLSFLGISCCNGATRSLVYDP